MVALAAASWIRIFATCTGFVELWCAYLRGVRVYHAVHGVAFVEARRRCSPCLDEGSDPLAWLDLPRLRLYCMFSFTAFRLQRSGVTARIAHGHRMLLLHVSSSFAHKRGAEISLHPLSHDPTAGLRCADMCAERGLVWCVRCTAERRPRRV